jgi:hypothetical protein
MWSIKYNPKSIRIFLLLSIEDNPECTETCSCVLTELGIGTGEWKLKYMS